MQATRGHSLESQREILSRYAEQQGWQVVADYQDVLSGSRSDRPGLKQLLDDAEKQLFDFVLILDPDRLSRMEPLEWEGLKAALREANVRLATPNQGIIDLDDEDDEFVADLLNLLARRERKKTGSRIARSIEHRVRQGQWKGGRPPFGYVTQGSILVPHEQEAEIYKKIVQMYLDGHSMRAICAYLNQQNIPSGKSGKIRWDGSRLDAIIENPIYAGYQRLHGKLYPHSFATLIDKDVHNELLAIRERRKLTRSKARNWGSNALLTGLTDIVSCGYCGRSVYFNGSDTYYCYTYQQSGLQRESHNKCLLAWVPRVDGFVSDAAIKLLRANEDQIHAQVLEDARRQLNDSKPLQEVARCKEQLEDLDRRLQRYLEQFEIGVLDAPVVKERITELHAQRQELVDKIETINSGTEIITPILRATQVIEFITSRRTWSSKWNTLPVTDRRTVIRHLFQSIRVFRSPQPPEVSLFSPTLKM